MSWIEEPSQLQRKEVEPPAGTYNSRHIPFREGRVIPISKHGHENGVYPQDALNDDDGRLVGCLAG